MAYENRPVIYTIASENGQTRIYTNDARVEKRSRDVTFKNNLLLQMMEFVTGTMNRLGFAVLFEVE